MIRVSIKRAEEAASQRPAGYLERLEKEASQKDEKFFHFEEKDYAWIKEWVAHGGKLSWKTVVSNAIKAGNQTVNKLLKGKKVKALPETVEKRKAICNDCQFWDAAGNMGFGKCLKCGCTKAKLLLAAQECPIGKWGAEEEHTSDSSEENDEGPKNLKSESDRHVQDYSVLKNLFANQSLFLITSGPSLTTQLNEKVKGRHGTHLLKEYLRMPGFVTMGVNNSTSVFRPDLWAHVDPADRFLLSVWQDPRITKFCSSKSLKRRLFDSVKRQKLDIAPRDCPNVFKFEKNHKFDPEAIISKGLISWGGAVAGEESNTKSVLLAALSLALNLGFKEIYVLGADFHMNPERPYCFDEIKKDSQAESNNRSYRNINNKLSVALPVWNKKGFQIFNTLNQSGLTALPFINISDAIERTESKIINPDLEKTRGLYKRSKKQ